MYIAQGHTIKRTLMTNCCLIMEGKERKCVFLCKHANNLLLMEAIVHTGNFFLFPMRRRVICRFLRTIKHINSGKEAAQRGKISILELPGGEDLGGTVTGITVINA